MSSNSEGMQGQSSERASEGADCRKLPVEGQLPAISNPCFPLPWNSVTIGAGAGAGAGAGVVSGTRVPRTVGLASDATGVGFVSVSGIESSDTTEFSV